jgi:hypothetical protein
MASGPPVLAWRVVLQLETIGNNEGQACPITV